MILRDEEVPALFTNKISPHQLGLADVLSALRFTGEFPKKLTLVGVIPESLEPHIGLTPTVEAMIEPALEQVLAALRAGIKTVMLPARNKRDLDDIPEEARNQLKFVFLETVDDAIRSGLVHDAGKIDDENLNK